MLLLLWLQRVTGTEQCSVHSAVFQLIHLVDFFFFYVFFFIQAGRKNEIPVSAELLSVSYLTAHFCLLSGTIERIAMKSELI